MSPRPNRHPGSFSRNPAPCSRAKALFLGSVAAILATAPSPVFAAENAAAPVSKGGFFSRSSKSAEKSAPAEPAPQTTRKTPSPAPASAAATTPAASSAGGRPQQTGGVETKVARRATPKKPTDAKTEDELFSSIRLQALEDPTVGDLRSRADKARDKEAGILATRAYLKSLYSKMRDLEPGLKDRIDLTETAALRGLTRVP